eukprot:1089940-Alexandrium_andersonii.AAC.1
MSPGLPTTRMGTVAYSLLEMFARTHLRSRSAVSWGGRLARPASFLLVCQLAPFRQARSVQSSPSVSANGRCQTVMGLLS